MNSSTFFSASEAARQLGVSTKALRLYEQRGLVRPGRTEAGYRSYGPAAMARAAEVAALRALGLSLAEVAQVFEGDSRSLGDALAARDASIEGEIQQLVNRLNKVREFSAGLVRGQKPADGELARLPNPPGKVSAAFALPWPWGGEWFELSEIRQLNYIIGPLGSGKTRFAMGLAKALPNAAFLGLDRLEGGSGRTAALLEADKVLGLRVAQTLAWLLDEGATRSDALLALLSGLEASGPDILVVDMVEEGLDQVTQELLISYLRQRGRQGARPLFLMTRSSAILDLLAVGPEETIIFCPANHSPPSRVVPFYGAPGYEAVVSCLASPEVRARTAGVVAVQSARPLPVAARR
jgi:DNA-binding transcriptional MerR regulator